MSKDKLARDPLEIRRLGLTKESVQFLEGLLTYLEENRSDFYVPTNFSFFGRVASNPNDFIELDHEDTRGYQILKGSIDMTTALRLMLGRRVLADLDLNLHLGKEEVEG